MFSLLRQPLPSPGTFAREMWAGSAGCSSSSPERPFSYQPQLFADALSLGAYHRTRLSYIHTNISLHLPPHAAQPSPVTCSWVTTMGEIASCNRIE